MKDQSKTKKQLIEELQELRQQVAELQPSEKQRRRTEVTSQKPADGHRPWFDNIADPIFIFHQETKRVLDCNQSMIDRYGYTLDELRTMTPYQLHPPEELEIVERNIDDLDDRAPHRYTHLTKEGKSLQVEVHTNEIEYEGQNAWVSVIRDITERMQAESQIIKLNQELASLNDIGQALISTLDLQEVLTIITDHVTRLLGVEAASVVLHDESKEHLWFAAASGRGADFMQSVRLKVGQGIAGWVVQHGEAVMVSNVSQDTRWFNDFDQVSGLTTRSILCVPLQTKGQIIGAIEVMNKKDGTFDRDDQRLLTSMTAPAATAIENARLYDQAQREIIERKQAADALRESEEKYRSILESIEEGYFEVDLAGNLTFFNDALCRFLGYPADELMGMNYRQYVDQETVEKVFQTFNTVYRTKEPTEIFDWEIIRKDGVARLVESSVSPIRDATDDPIGFRGMVRDVTGHKQAETERERLLAILEHRSTQLQTAAEVSRAVGSILDPEALAPQVVDLVRERFNLYYAGLFLIDQTGEWTDEPYKWAVLRAGTGTAGQQMLRQKHKLEIGGSSMIGWCIANKQARITLDVGEDAVRFENPMLPKTRSELALPLVSRGKPIGALSIQSDQEAAFSQADIVALQTMADQMANAIANARLYNQAQREINERKRAELEAQRRAAQATLVYEVGQRVSGELELEVLLSEIVTAVRDAFDYYGTMLLLLDEESERLTLQAIAGGYAETFPQDLSYAIGEGIIGHAAATGEPQLSGDVAKNPYYVRKVSEETKSELSVPIKSGRKVIGVLDLQGDKFNAFDESDVMVMETMADQIGVAIRNAQLYNAMRQAEQRYLAVAESKVVGLGIMDPKENLIFANPAFAEMLGYTQDALVGMNLSQLAVPVESIGHREQTREREPGLPQSAHSHYETALRRKDESTLNILVSGSPLTAADGSFQGTLAVIVDITERKQAEEALQGALEELAQYTDSLERQTAQLQVGAEVAREAAAILDVQRLLDTAVRLISERFGFYHAGAFLVDDPGEYAVMRAASSEGGRRMLDRGHKLSIGKVGIVGYVAATGEPRVALDVGQDATHFAHSDLPDTRSEMGLPLNVRGRTIGVLDVQDTLENAFSDNDVAALQTLADQLAVAVDNARLVERTEAQLRELGLLYGEYSASTWAELASPERSLGYVYDRIDVMPTGKLSTPAIDMALTRGETIALTEPEAVSGTGGEKTLATPLKLHGQIIGSLGIQETDRDREWSHNEIALIEAVSDQVALALENAQHFAEAQKSAQQRQALNELARALATRLDVKTVLEETYWGTSRLLDTTNFYIAFHDPATNGISFPLVVENDERTQLPSRQLGEGLTEHIIRNRQPVLIQENVSEWLEEQGIEIMGIPAASWLGVPLLVGDRVLGIMAVQSETTSFAYDEHDQDLLTAIASQTAIALQNAQLFKETESALGETEALYLVGEIIGRLGDREETLQALADVLVSQLGYATSWLALVDKGAQTLKGIGGAGMSENIITTQITLDAQARDPAVQAVLDREAVVISNVSTDERAANLSQRAREKLGRLAEIPILIGNETVGVIAVSRPTSMPEISARDVEVLQAVADQAAVALQNIRLLEETQRRAVQERRIYEITSKIRRSSNIATILQTAVEELGQTLQTDRALVRLVVKPRGAQKDAQVREIEKSGQTMGD